MSSARFLISGRVQGVFFRASTRDEALRLGLNGYARNLADGRVEVVADGRDEALHELEQWLWQGPPAARVDDVARSAWDAPVAHGFSVG
ncbi:acylphosphatase [Dyella caseinilytica]|uniref:Acylphosphatase n=1 Tax=Dyella caseinilytica TaxID=1849581 RepID=A0ABX7GRJ6_9GAMM|nr:acylphosphatase [Dyella caseinilytica]QRN52681.1 acylphosphatase [Dyella caseinilytica]GGA07840.1 acylphosphatase [Dyella caseinilytica]